MGDKVPSIYELVPKIMESIGAIGKNQINQGQRFNFRGIDDVYNAVQPALVAHKCFIVPEVLDAVRTERTSRNGGGLAHVVLRVKYSVFAPDGSHVDAIVEGEAMDSGDKATSKALSMAMKYAIFQIFTIPTNERDADADSYDVAPAGNGRALKTAKRRLMAQVRESRTDEQRDALSDVDFIRAIKAHEFGDREIATVEDVEVISEAVRLGLYDLNTGKSVEE